MNQLTLARPYLVRWCIGRGVDLGCNSNKIKKDAIGIDIQSSSMVNIVANVFVKLPFKNNCFNYIFSSHCLEDAEPNKVSGILDEWLRILKHNHFLILYMPDKDFYYNVGHPKANGDHKKDYYWQDMWNILKNKNTQLRYHYRGGRYDNKRNPINVKDWKNDNYGEWSFTLVVKKLQEGVANAY